MSNIKIGLSSSALYPSPVSKTFEVASRLGYDGVEVMVTHSQNSRGEERLQDMIQKYQIPILSFHAPNLLLTSFVWGRSHHNKMFQTVELAQKLNVDTIVVHPPMRTERRHAKNFLDNVAELERESGLKVAVENMFPWRVGTKEARIYAPTWDEITAKANNLTIDFSHAALSGLNILELATEFKDKIAHIHLCDGRIHDGSISRTKDEHLLPGYGDQPIPQTLQFLNNNNWQGSVVAEVNLRHLKNSQAKLKALKETLDYTRKYVSS